jgi:hypothetical protein
MTDLATLQLQLEALKAARRTGARVVAFKDHRIEYRSDEELVAAIASLEAEIAGTTVNTVVIRSSKGW